MKKRNEPAEEGQRRFTLSVLALPNPDKRPMAYSNAGATGAIQDLTDDADEIDAYVERLSNLPTSFTGIPEDRARNLARKLEQYGAEFELIPAAEGSGDQSQATFGVTITALPKPDKDPAWPRNTRVMVCYSEYAKVEGRVARLALLELPAIVQNLEREDAEQMIARIREAGGSADLTEP